MTTRLLALVLGAHLPPGSAHAAVDREMLGHLSGLALPELSQALDLLADRRFLRSWTFEAVSEDVRWALWSPNQLTHDEP
ncbi:hypothetical protein ABT025_35145 [Streptomyces sp. NPDC002809]|uniref:hypothetical protein n=1 Tax=Streptomyces sp. NPDC002809 TaxID=3154433 RepID=UPI00331EEB47